VSFCHETESKLAFAKGRWAKSKCRHERAFN